jgi:hypothetical protein
METVTPSTVDHGEEIVSSKPQVLPPNVQIEKPIEMSPHKGKGEKKSGKPQPVEKWRISDFVKDAAWFATNVGLPNEGEAPHKIVDIPEEAIKACFGDRSRNGYKLSTCIGIPTEVILALSQVIDGYDKPVNGVLSHSFVRGAYAERILKRKVNWAAYAASKLKGQLVQWEREGKPKPDGPPCVRKARMYQLPPSVVESKPNVRPMEVSKGLLPCRMEKAITVADCGVQQSIPSNLSALYESLVKEVTTSAVPNSLLSIVDAENAKLKKRQEEVRTSLRRVEVSMERLKELERNGPSDESKLTEQVKSYELDLKDIEAKIASEEDFIEELTQDIELESNKQDADPNDEVQSFWQSLC